jgi:hypothetical protein
LKKSFPKITGLKKEKQLKRGKIKPEFAD